MSTISALANALPILPPISPPVNTPKTNATTPGNNASVMIKSTNSLANNLNSTPGSAINNPSSNLSSIMNTPNTNANQTNNSALSSAAFVEEKVYKKEKQILIEFDSKTKDLKSQLNEGLKGLEQRMDTQISIIYELQDFFKKRAEVEMQYSRDLDKLTKQILAKHKSEKSKRENWHMHSVLKLWEALLNDTKQHSKYHQVASDVCSKYVAERFDDIIDDIKRIFVKCKTVGQTSHEEIFKVVGELNAAIKTYHEYQSESKQAEAKLKYVQSQKPKFEKQKSKKKLKQYEKQVEKRLQKYTETKVKAFKARNEYILSVDSANACIKNFSTEDIGDLVDCMDFGLHASVAKCIYNYLSAQENVKRSRQFTIDNISRTIGDLDSNADKIKYLESFAYIFNIQKKFQFEPHKGDEVSQVNAQSLIRYEMEKRFEQLDNRLKTLKTENDEIFKTIEATEQSLLSYFDVKNCDMSDLFRDLNLPNHNTAINKQKRVEIEDYYVEKVRQFTTSSNLIARLEARHGMMQKALMGCVNSSDTDKMSGLGIDMNTQKVKKKIGKSPLIGQPRLFGGKLIEYINVTKQEIPQIITSCIKAINRLGLHNQGIFRIPGSQLEINQFKEAFEKGEDPLITVNPREMNSVAGVLKLYLRELKDPIFPRDMYDSFLNALRGINTTNLSVSSPSACSQTNTESSPQIPSTPNTNNSNNINSGDAILSNTAFTFSSIDNSESSKVDNIRKVMNNVPKPIFIVIRYIFGFLNHLSEFKDENMMDAYNIAICLAPTLIPVPEDKKDQVNHQTDTIELIKLIIQHYDEIFSMECDGQVYSKFDSDGIEGIEEDNIEESDDDEEEESEKQFMRNLSDDDIYSTEAIALYDYKGRSEKEISFKKGTILAIKGQLSADWWQGSLLATQNSNETPKLGYIPDKYIALRSNTKRKQSTSSSLVMTPLSANSSAPTGNLLNSNKQTTSLGTNSIKNRIACTELNINRNNLTDLCKVKESDILNDDDNDGGFRDQFKNNTLRSSNNSISFSQHIKQPTFCLHENKTPRNDFSIKTRTPSTSSSIQPKAITNNSSNNTSLDDLLLTNKQMLKMNHIEDALASVLDDMKQLDFATTPSKGYTQANPVLSTLKNSNNNFLKSMSSSCANGNNSYGYFNTPIGNINSNPLNIKTDIINKEQTKTFSSLNKQRAVNFSEDFDLSGSENSSEELNLQFRKNLSSQVKQLEKSVDSLINGQDSKGQSDSNNSLSQRIPIKTRTSLQTSSPPVQNNQNDEVNLNTRPDLVLDLPINLLVSSPNSVSITNNQQLSTALNIPQPTATKRETKNLTNENCNSPLGKQYTIDTIDLDAGSLPNPNLLTSLPSSPSPEILVKNHLEAKEHKLHSSSTHSSSSSTSSSSSSANDSSSMSSNLSNSIRTPTIRKHDIMSQSVQYHRSMSTQTNLVNNNEIVSSKIEPNILTQSFHSKINDNNFSHTENLTTKTVSSENFCSTNDIVVQKLTNGNLIKISNNTPTSHSYKHHTSKIVTLPCPRIPVILNNVPISTTNENTPGKPYEEKDHVQIERSKIITRPPKAVPISKTEAKVIPKEEIPSETVVNESLKKDELSTLNMQQSNDPKVTPIKKKPPPIMQKPEKSDEILRKLGRSPPTDQNQIGSNSVQQAPNSFSSNISSMSSSSTTNNSSNGSIKANMSVRLSNSKATDV